MKVLWYGGVFLVAVFLLGVLNFLQQLKLEGFESSSNINAVQADLGKLVKSVTTIGKKLLDPETWNYRIQIMNLSPVELARKQLAREGNPSPL